MISWATDQPKKILHFMTRSRPLNEFKVIIARYVKFFKPKVVVLTLAQFSLPLQIMLSSTNLEKTIKISYRLLVHVLQPTPMSHIPKRQPNVTPMSYTPYKLCDKPNGRPRRTRCQSTRQITRKYKRHFLPRGKWVHVTYTEKTEMFQDL